MNVKFFLQRLAEPSSWAGIGAIAMAFGIPSTGIAAIGQAVVAVCGAAAVLMPEKGASAAK